MISLRLEKKAAVFIYILLTLLVSGMTFMAIRFHSFWGFATDIILLIAWILTVIIAFFLIPIYFTSTKILISNKQISKETIFINHKVKTMPTESIASITVLITPLGKFTGLNMVVINSLGARLFIPFISKESCNIINKHLQ